MLKKSGMTIFKLFIVVIVTGLLSGCSSTMPPTIEDPKEVLLNIVLPGNPQPDQANVTAALEKALKAELNIKLKFSSIPWNDYADTVKIMATSGEGIDIFWTYPELLGSLMTSNSVAVLDSALKTVGKDLTANIPAEYWAPVKAKGKIFAVPSVALGTGQGFFKRIIRKDLREKYGLPEIKTLQDLNNFYAAVLENDPGIIPLALGPNMQPNNVVGYTKAVYTRGLPNGLGIDMETMKAINVFESPDFKLGCTIFRNWYLNKYISKDLLLIKDEYAPFKEGKAASCNGDLYRFNEMSKALTTIPGAKVEFAKVYTGTDAYQEVTTWNFLSIAAHSKQIEKALAFINWIQKNQANYDLMTLGIKGIHYVEKDGLISYPTGIDAANSPYSPYEWIWQNPKYMKAKISDVPDFLQMLKSYDSDVNTRFKGMGFLFDTSNVKTEIAAIDGLATELMVPLVNGVVDPAIVLPQLQKKAKAAEIDKVVDEAQKQLDAFMAAQK